MAHRKRAPEYTAWANIVARCHNPRHRDYAGGLVIVCDRWRVYANFLADMGARPSELHVLDRFPNTTGNYEPGNVVWVTYAEKGERDGRTLFVANLKRMPNGCLEWQLSRNKDGYGLVGRHGIRRQSFLYAHRYAWFLEHGRWPEPECLHHCDNPPCCEITHLYEGTQQDNMRDMVERRRYAHKLTDELVDQIRRATGTLDEIADRFGISPSSVWAARKGTYKTNRTGLAATLRSLVIGQPQILTPKRPASLLPQAHLLGMRIKARRLDDGKYEVIRTV